VNGIPDGCLPVHDRSTTLSGARRRWRPQGCAVAPQGCDGANCGSSCAPIRAANSTTTARSDKLAAEARTPPSDHHDVSTPIDHCGSVRLPPATCAGLMCRDAPLATREPKPYRTPVPGRGGPGRRLGPSGRPIARKRTRGGRLGGGRGGPPWWMMPCPVPGR
jgi:hypothetical protein